MSCDSPGAQAIRTTFQMLGRAHMLDILHHFTAAAEPVRFNDLQRQLGVSPNTLSARLKDLEAAGFVTRTAFNTIPPRVDYEATVKARGLCPVFDALHAWVDAHETIEVTA